MSCNLYDECCNCPHGGVLGCGTYFESRPVGLPDDIIFWSEARHHIDENVKLYGEVVGTRCKSFPDKPTFLTIGAKYPNPERVQVAIWPKERMNYPSNPGTLFFENTVLVTGKLYLHKGDVWCKVDASTQIEVEVFIPF